MTRLRPTTLFALLAMVALTTAVNAADHLDAPDLRRSGQGQSDINDLYAFKAPGSDNNVLVMTVNPFAGLMNPFGIASPQTFGTDVEYQIQIDQDGNATPDVTFATTFGTPASGVQTYSITRNGSPYATGTTGAISPGLGANVTSTAGVFDDPFSFDLFGFNATVQSVLDGAPSNEFTGADPFKGANVSAIVLELPTSDLVGANDLVGVWARTVDIDTGTQIDRMGNPGINTALVGLTDSSRKDAFNAGVPADDQANFGDEIEAVIDVYSDIADPGNVGFTSEQIRNTLLPDTLNFDTSVAATSFSTFTGRALADDVIDFELDVLTDGFITTDGAPVDSPFLSVFPYLAPANPIPEPGTLGLVAIAVAGAGLVVRSRR